MKWYKLWRLLSVSLLILLVIIVIAGYVMIQYGFLDPRTAGLIKIKLRQPDFHYYPWIIILYAHIITGCLALGIGLYQLLRKPAAATVRSWKKLHKAMGKIYAASVLVSGAVSFYLSLFASGGWVAKTGFIVMDTVWVLTTLIAIDRIRRGQIQAHKNWMLRSYSITFSAVTLRLYLSPLVALMGHFETAYCVTAWLCWVSNLMIAEAWIRSKDFRTTPKAPSKVTID